MSTKLTARKRYLPRITEAVKDFNAMALDLSFSSAASNVFYLKTVWKDWVGQ